MILSITILAALMTVAFVAPAVFAPFLVVLAALYILYLKFVCRTIESRLSGLLHPRSHHRTVAKVKRFGVALPSRVEEYLHRLELKLVLGKRAKDEHSTHSALGYSHSELGEDLARIFPGKSYVVQTEQGSIESLESDQLKSLTRILCGNLSYFQTDKLLNHRDHVSLQAFARHRKNFSFLIRPQAISSEIQSLLEARGEGIPELPTCWILFESEPQLSEQQIAEAKRILSRYCEGELLKSLCSRPAPRDASQASLDIADLAHLSHDLRSPITSIRYILELFLDNELADDEVNEYLTIAMRNCHWVSDIIDDILDFHRFQNGRLSAERTEVSLHELLTETVAGLEPLARKKGLALAYEPDKVSPTVFVDRKQFRRVLGNLLANACKYTDHGSVSIKLEGEGSDRCRIAIRDTGKGMNKEEVAQAFEAFSRFHTSSGAEGVGLGLAVVKALCDLSEVSIEIDSEKGSGTTVYLELNAISWKNLVAPVRRLLLVDDDRDYLQTCTKVLNAAGYNVKAVAGVAEAIRAFRSESFDAVITDGSLDDGDASDVVSAIRANNKELPIVVATGDTREEHVSRLKTLGANAVLQKPISMENLAEIFADPEGALRRAA